MLRSALSRGWQRTVKEWRVILPFWAANVLLSLLALWPLYLAFGSGLLHRPFLRELALDPAGQSISSVMTELSFDQLLPLGLGWLLSFLVLLLASGTAYNFFAGGVLSRYAGRRSFWSGCRRFFWPFTLLGLLAITSLIFLSAVLALLPGRFGLSAQLRLVVLLVLAELLNLLFEYARVLTVLRDDRHAALRLAWRFCRTHLGGVLLFAVLTRLALAVILLLYTRIASFLTPLSLVALLVIWRQLTVLLQQWLKFLRLSWALAFAEPVV